MPRYSPPYYGSPRRVYSSRGRSPPRGGSSPPRGRYSPPRRGYSPPRRGYGGHGGGRGRKEQSNGSLLVRNIPLDCRPEELRVPFERFGLVRDVYIPKDYYTGEPRGFAFVQFVNPYDASEAQYCMNRQIFGGREISVVVAAETRKRPEDMRKKTRIGGSRHGGRRSPNGHSRSRSVSRSPLPHDRTGSRGKYRSRSYSASPRRHGGHSVSPGRRHIDRSHSPGDKESEHGKKLKYEAEEARDHRDNSPRRVSRSPSGSRSRSADKSPAKRT